MKKYYYDGATRVAMRTGNSTLNWLFGDHLGSSSLAANSDGSLLPNGEQRYKPWGEKRFPTGDSAIPTSFKFTGQRQESSLGGSDGLYYYNARYYDPYLAHFIQADPIVPDIKDAQSLDRYAYVINNPVRYTDPSGYCKGNEYDTHNPDAYCWSLIETIQKTFPNVKIGTPRAWTAPQLQTLLDALTKVRDIFGSQAAFAKALGIFKVRLFSSLPNGALGITPPGRHIIYLSAALFQKSYADQLWYIIHEMGHIFDFNGAEGSPSRYKSQKFVDKWGNNCILGPLGCLNSANLRYPCWLNEYACSGYNPDPNDTTGYGSNSSIDDFAESFAAYVLSITGVVSPDRLLFIKQFIDQYRQP
jgi:RHS repeat-associated protein